MPLASLFTIQYYGKAAAAVIDQVEVEVVADAKKWQRANSTDQVTVDTVSRATEVIGQAFTDQVVVDTVSEAKNRSRVNLNDSIGASPSEYDIAQAVWLIAASAINYPGTAGAKLNSAGSGGAATLINPDTGEIMTPLE